MGPGGGSLRSSYLAAGFLPPKPHLRHLPWSSPACLPACRLGTALVIGGLMARGMHRGGLARTSTNIQSPSAVRAAAAAASAGLLRRSPNGSSTPAASLLLPAITIPIIRQNGGVTPADLAPALLGGDAAAAAKKDSGTIAVDVQAGALASLLQLEAGTGSAVAASTAHARSPVAGSGMGAGSVTTRRKTLDLG